MRTQACYALVLCLERGGLTTWVNFNDYFLFLTAPAFKHPNSIYFGLSHNSGPFSSILVDTDTSAQPQR